MVSMAEGWSWGVAVALERRTKAKARHARQRHLIRGFDEHPNILDLLIVLIPLIRRSVKSRQVVLAFNVLFVSRQCGAGASHYHTRTFEMTPVYPPPAHPARTPLNNLVPPPPQYNYDCDKCKHSPHHKLSPSYYSPIIS